jgi:hypothetical protein
MIQSNWIKNIYYSIKPLLPRPFQISMRRKLVRQQLAKYSHVWQILEKASQPPKCWCGWPEDKQFALVLTHDVDTAAGQQKCRDLAELEIKMGFRSSFNFVPERYRVSKKLRTYLVFNGFEVGVHGLNHDGKLFKTINIFNQRARRINYYLNEWNAVGFRAPAMHHNLDWMHSLDIEYDLSTFDTDPFEPQSDGVETIFPFWVNGSSSVEGYMELPYTLPQDFTIFILMQEQNIGIWARKLDWLVNHGGMALINTHPDYMAFSGKQPGIEEYSAAFYEEFLDYVKSHYSGQYWHALPSEVARHARNNINDAV